MNENKNKINSFKDLKVWQKSHVLVLEVYKITQGFPRNEEFGLTSQIRRAAVSIPSNIAEGFKRKSTKDSLHFYNIAEGSLEEVRYQLILARDLGYIDSEKYDELELIADEVSRMLCGWIKSQKGV